MTDQTPFLGNVPLPFGYKEMTLLTSYPPFGHTGMIKSYPLIFDRLFGNPMASITSGKSFSSGEAPKMAEKTGAFSYCHMTPLNDLGVATGASQFLRPFHHRKMGTMIEKDLLKSNGSAEKSFLMASLPETALITHFRPGFSPVSSGYIFGHRGYGLELTLQLRLDAGWEMTITAGDVFMLRGLPVVIVRLHVMAGETELRGKRVLKSDESQD